MQKVLQIAIKDDKINAAPLMLGQAGENLATRVVIDVSEWMTVKQNPDGKFALLVKRADGEVYPAVITVADDTVIWDVLAVDAGVAGKGQIELSYTDGNIVSKTAVCATRVDNALVGGSIPPSESQWSQQVLEAAGTAQTSAQIAVGAKIDAEAAAQDAAEAKINAETAAQDAAGAKINAEAAAQDAVGAKINAEAAAQDAAEAKINAEAAAQIAVGAKIDAEAAAQDAAEAKINAETAAQDAAGAKIDAEAAAQDAAEAKIDAETAAQYAVGAKIDAEAAAQDAAGAKIDAEAAAQDAAGAKIDAEAAAQDAVGAKINAEAAAQDAAEAKINAEAAAQDAAESAALAGRQSGVDNTVYNDDYAWGARHMLEAVCKPIEERGDVVSCYPVAGSGLGATVETVAGQTVTAQGKNMLDLIKSPEFTNNNATVERTPNGIKVAAESVNGYPSCTYVVGRYSDYKGRAITLSVGSMIPSGSNPPWINVLTMDADNGARDIFMRIGSGSSATAIVPDNVDDAVYIGVSLYANNASPSVIGDCVEYANVQVELGDTATPYEPFVPNSPPPEYPAKIVGVGGVEVNQTGKNLIDQSKWRLDTSPLVLSATSEELTLSGIPSGRYRQIPVDYDIYPDWIGKTIVANWDESGNDSWCVLYGVRSDGTYYTLYNSENRGTPTVLESDTHHLRIVYCLNKGYTSDTDVFVAKYSKVQIEFGEAATPYEPYQGSTRTLTPQEPLYGLPNAVDSIAVDTDGVVTEKHNTKKLILNGSEVWYTLSSNTPGYSRIARNYPPDMLVSTETDKIPNLVCSHYVTTSPDGTYLREPYTISAREDANGVGRIVYVYDPLFASEDKETILQSWRAYLKAQYDAGTPMTIVYELETPTITTQGTTHPPITAIDGVNNLCASTGTLTVTGVEDPRHTRQQIEQQHASDITTLTNAILSLGGNI